MDVLHLLKNRDFRFLFVPDILRGFGCGMLSIISLIAIRVFLYRLEMPLDLLLEHLFMLHCWIKCRLLLV